MPASWERCWTGRRPQPEIGESAVAAINRGCNIPDSIRLDAVVVSAIDYRPEEWAWTIHWSSGQQSGVRRTDPPTLDTREYAREAHNAEPTANDPPTKFGEPRRYRSDDRDLEDHDQELIVFNGGNGDWYISIVKTGEKLGPAVRVTTHGTPRGFEHLPVAVKRLWDALEGPKQ